MTIPNYRRKLIEGGWISEPGEQVEVVIHHYDSCVIWKGQTCDCGPDIELVDRNPKGQQNETKI